MKGFKMNDFYGETSFFYYYCYLCQLSGYFINFIATRASMFCVHSEVFASGKVLAHASWFNGVLLDSR